jgi:hypothetical protein
LKYYFESTFSVKKWFWVYLAFQFGGIWTVKHLMKCATWPLHRNQCTTDSSRQMSVCVAKILTFNLTMSTRAHPTIVSKKFTTARVAWRVLKTNAFSSTFKNALAYYVQRWHCSCKFKSRRICFRFLKRQWVKTFYDVGYKQKRNMFKQFQKKIFNNLCRLRVSREWKPDKSSVAENYCRNLSLK